MKGFGKTSLIQKIFRVLLGSFMVLAAVGHLTFQRQEFQAQVPDWVPLSKDLVVILSGIAELGLGLSMIFWKKQRVYVGLALATFYVLIFPGNIAQYLGHREAFGLNTDTARLIRLFFQPVLILWALWSTGALTFLTHKGRIPNAPNFYDFEALDMRGNPVKLSDYAGKTVLVVNTATQCGLTPQFEGLENLYQKYKSEHFVILGFPCNQFANQEPGDNESIAQTCSINYGVTFPLFGKIDVNGKNAHPLFTYLKDELGGVLTDDIKWNFTKFLIDKNGNPVKRFVPITKPESIEPTVKQVL